MINLRPSVVSEDFALLYPKICKSVVMNGRPSAPRGLVTREVLDAAFELTDPRNCLPVGTGRKLHTGVGAVEALQLIAGESWPQLMAKVTPNFKNFMNGEILHGAYGPRVGNQIWDVMTKLEDDPSTRQAVINIFDGTTDNRPGLKDVPCTIALQFTVREGRLNMHVRMRSNDIWWGLPYDVFQFCQLQINVAAAFDYTLGSYFHTATSLHAYERDFDKVHELVLSLTPANSPWRSPLANNFSTAQVRARDIMGQAHKPETNVERWYTGAIHRAA